jgi:O-antigen/teichoic acid export membrane protein
MSSALAKLTAMSSAFISVPLTIRYLGMERYGMWMTISSISSMLAFSDFGMGNGLLSKLAAASGRDDREAAARALTSALAMLGAIAACVASAFALSYPFVRWSGLLNLKTALAGAEAGPAAAVFVACFALSLPIGTAQRIQMAHQETFQSNLWLSAGSIAGLACLLFAIHLRLGLPWLIAAVSGAPLVVSALNLSLQLRYSRPWISPQLRYFRFTESRQLLRTGFAFLSIQLGTSIAFYSDNFIIAHFLGPGEVARYSVGIRLFTVMGLLPQFVFTPLWPAYSEAFARGDMRWIQNTLRRTAPFGFLLSAPVGLCLLVIAPWFIRHWTHGYITLSWAVLLALFVSSLSFCLSYPHGILIWGLHRFRFSAGSMAIVALSSVILKILLIPRIGILGAALSTAICYGLFASMPNILYSRSLVRRYCDASA